MPCAVDLLWLVRHSGNGVSATLPQLQSQAVMETVLQAAHLPSVYQLTKRFGRHAYDPGSNVSATEWAETRNRLFGRWRSGRASMFRSKDGSLTIGARDLLDSLDRDSAAAANATLSWRLWRLLDPTPIPLNVAADMVSERKFSFDWPSIYLNDAWSPKEISRHCLQVTKFLEAPETRREALEALWLTIRTAGQIEDLPSYIISYALWLNAEKLVQSDPILGKLTAGLYAHAETYFSLLRLLPPSPASAREAESLIWDCWIPFAVETCEPPCYVIMDAVLCNDLNKADLNRRGAPWKVIPSILGNLVFYGQYESDR